MGHVVHRRGTVTAVGKDIQRSAGDSKRMRKTAAHLKSIRWEEGMKRAQGT